MEVEKEEYVFFYDGKEIGECDFKLVDGRWNIYHTEVEALHQGKGVAKRLVFKVLEAAERECV